MKKFVIVLIISLISFNVFADENNRSEENNEFCNFIGKTALLYAIARQSNVPIFEIFEVIYEEKNLGDEIKELQYKLAMKAYEMPVANSEAMAKVYIKTYAESVYNYCLYN